MDRRQRMTLLGIAAAIAVAAVVIALVAGGGDDDGDTTTTQTTAADTATATTETEQQQTPTETTPPEPEATTAEIDLTGGEPDGGIQEIKTNKDERLEITVNSDQEVPIHFHGYDIEKDAGPDKPAVFKLKTDIEGVFEIEVESTGTKIAEVTVEP